MGLSWKQLKPTIGYFTIRKYRGKFPYAIVGIRGKTIRVHRLVLETFMGPCPPNHEATHQNGNSLDNRLKNLKWKTHKENCQDRIRHGTQTRGTFIHNALLNEAKVREIKKRLKTRLETHDQIAKDYGVKRIAVTDINRGRTWKHVV